MIYAMTCADERYMPAAKFQLETAVKNGKVNKTLFFCIDEMDEEFRKKNARILNAGGERRKGCYLWKPYFIHKAFARIEYGDFLVYLDAAGNYYRSRVNEITLFMEKNGLDMIGSRNWRYFEKDWTKRDAFVMLDCDNEKYMNQNQCYAGFLVLKKTEKTEKFMNEWLEYCQNYHIIADCPNISGKDNYEGFIEHRFDQSILSLLMAKHDVPNIEKLPVPMFCVYHHTMLQSVKEIRRELRKRRHRTIFESIMRHDIGTIWLTEKEAFMDLLWFQRIYKRIAFGLKR